MQDRSSKDGMTSCRIGPVKMGCHHHRSSKDGMVGPVEMGCHHAG